MSITKSYNVLDGEIREFAKKHKLPTSERCVRKHKSGRRPTGGVEEVAGNGEFGFSRRRLGEDLVDFELTIDGTGLKKKRGTVVRKRKNVSRLATKEECSKDFENEDRKNRKKRKMERQKNRNRKARYGRKESF